jgi:hypothetical protein
LYTLVPPWVGAQIIGSNMNLSSSNIKNAKWSKMYISRFSYIFKY